MSTRMLPMTIVSVGPEATKRLGARLAALLQPGDVVLLHGDLGAGKTTLTQGIATGLGITGSVQSPTFTLVSEHPGVAADGSLLTLYHLDLYRLGGPEDLRGNSHVAGPGRVEVDDHRPQLSAGCRDRNTDADSGRDRGRATV